MSKERLASLVAGIGRRLHIGETYSEPQSEVQPTRGVLEVAPGQSVNALRGQVLLDILRNLPDPVSTHDLHMISGYGYDVVRKALNPYRQNSTVINLREEGTRSLLWKYNPDQEPK